MGDYTTFDVDGRSVAGTMPLQPDLSPIWNLYINVEDTDGRSPRRWSWRRSRAGIDARTIGRIAFLREPQGAAFTLSRALPRRPPSKLGAVGIGGIDPEDLDVGGEERGFLERVLQPDVRGVPVDLGKELGRGELGANHGPPAWSC